jgi:Na+/proline symporter
MSAYLLAALGGFKVSFITDTVQGIMACGVVVISTIAVGAKVKVDTSLIEPSGLLDASLVGWQLIWILPVAILTNDFFLSGLWLRTFASKSDKDLLVGVTLATVGVAIILTLVGTAGLLAIWSGAVPLHDPHGVGAVSLFILLRQLPSWVIGIVLVMTVTLSAAAFDSLQSSMVSSASNDFFRNKLGIWWIRGMVVLVIIPVIVVALKTPDILQIYLIVDLVSAALVPVLVLGLSDRFYFLRGFELVVGTLGGILAVFIFGTIYYGNAKDGANLIILEGGLYEGDWGAFGK